MALYHPDGSTLVPPEETPLHQALHHGMVRNAELVIRNPNGDRRTIVASGRALHDREGRRLGAVVGMHDITEQKALEDQLRHQAFHDALTGLPRSGPRLRPPHARPGSRPAPRNQRRRPLPRSRQLQSDQ